MPRKRYRITPGQPLELHVLHRKLKEAGLTPAYTGQRNARATFPLDGGRALILANIFKHPPAEHWDAQDWSATDAARRQYFTERVELLIAPKRTVDTAHIEISYANGTIRGHIEDPTGLCQLEDTLGQLQHDQVRTWRWIWPQLRKFAIEYSPSS